MAAFFRRQSRSAEAAAGLKMKAALFKVFFAIHREKRAEREREMEHVPRRGRRMEPVSGDFTEGKKEAFV